MRLTWKAWREAAGHEDRHQPLKNYCKGLLLDGDRKSIEPMAARLAPESIEPMRQSLHHLVAKAPWSDEALLGEVRTRVLPVMQKHGPVVAWIVDDTGFPKKGRHSVGVTRQYCGQVGKQENCRVAVSLSVATWSSSLPIAYRLYLPEVWVEDTERRKKTEVPAEVKFQTKPEIALDQIRAAVAAEVPRGFVLADAAYGINTEFRDELTRLGLQYAVGVQSSMTVWEPGKQPLPAKPRKIMGWTPRLLQRSDDHHPVSVRQLALSLPSGAFRIIAWREAGGRKLQSRFAAVRVRPAHRDYWRAEPHAEEWLLIEWPKGDAEPFKVLDLDLAGGHHALRLSLKSPNNAGSLSGTTGTEAGTGTGTLRRAQLARLPPSRHIMYCSLWVPCGRAESFFPLCPCRSNRTRRIRPRPRLPAARFA